MKRLLFLLLLVFMMPQSVNAAAIAPAPMPPIYDSAQPNIFGQDQYYSVTFRGNGEAVVSLKVILTNNSENSLAKIDLRVPKINPTDIFAYQVIKENVNCIRYGEMILSPDSRVKPVPQCLEYQESDYYQMWGQAKYQKATTVYEGDTVTVVLPKPIAPEKTGSYLLYFRGFGFAKKNIAGGFDYTFESLKVNDKIRTLQVGISTDSDLVLKESGGQVNYRTEMAPMMALKGDTAVSNSQLDNFYQQIGYGQINKTASNLMPLESYTVKGAYADSSWKNYMKELGVGLTCLIGVIGLISLIGKNFSKNKFIVAGIAGFAAAALITGFTVLLWFLTQNGINNYYYYNQFSFITGIFLAIISFAVYGILLLLPGIIFGVKRGWSVGLATFIFTIIFISVFFIIFILSMGFNRPQNIYPATMMKGSAVESTPPVIQFPENAGPAD